MSFNNTYMPMKHLLLLLITVIVLYRPVTAQETEPKTTFNVNYTTEGLWNATNSRANWINILDVSIDRRLWDNAFFTINLLSVNNLRESDNKGSIADELTVFSAIEDGNTSLALFMFGLTQRIGAVELFIGVRNVNNDYFTSPWNSVFTGSTNGLLPIISHNFPLSDSPLSSMCLHAEWVITKNLLLRNSLYNGVAYDNWDARFRFRPKKDGLMNITELSYVTDRKQSGSYRIGAVWGDVRNPETGKKENNYSFWMLLEQPVLNTPTGRELELILQGGASPDSPCDSYLGAGFVLKGANGKDDYIGILANRTWHCDGNETDIEATYAHTKGMLTLQPAIHMVLTGQCTQVIGMLKLTVGLDYGE